MTTYRCTDCPKLGDGETMHYVPEHGVVCPEHHLIEYRNWNQGYATGAGALLLVTPFDTVSEHEDRSKYNTVEEAEPTDAELLEWATGPGLVLDAFVEDVAMRMEPAEVTTVPYGSTTVELAPMVDPQDADSSLLLDVANAWWEDERLTWSAEHALVAK